MNDETTTYRTSQNSSDGSQLTSSSSRSVAGELTIAVAATFTTNPLKQPLVFWMQTLGIAASVELAPYAQLIQELLSPDGTLARNSDGFNTVLVRLDDWIRDRDHSDIPGNIVHVRGTGELLIKGITALRTRGGAPLLLFFCPPSSSLPVSYSASFAEIQSDLIARVSSIPNVYCWDHAQLMRIYPVAEHEDLRADRIGHVPYTNEYFAALATVFVRHITALSKLQYKVIAVDCDNTLWRGVCGEDGPASVQLTPAHIEFQEMLIRQHDAGVLLCLCSKNNEADVASVFKNRPEMPLREEHFICSRVNWSAKSSNLQSIAEELDLALDSFMLIDDSALECAEVCAHCPSVLTLKFPETEQEIRHFLDHVWAFDKVGATDDARKRTALYKQNRDRKKAREQATDLREFLASLELHVDVAPMRPDQLGRVSELIQRTNQFNLTGIRRRAAELDALLRGGDLQCLVVTVRDRFGDYGLVGAVLFRRHAEVLEVDSFVLSCRVLGRGVEHRIVGELARIAREVGIDRLALLYRPTARNTPARAFLERTVGRFGTFPQPDEADAQCSFVVPVAFAENLQIDAEEGEPSEERAGIAGAKLRIHDSAGIHWHEAALRLSRVSEVLDEMYRATPHDRRSRAEFVAPRTPGETAIAQIWAELLRLPEIGIRDDFFESGGDSVAAVQVIARIGSVFGLELPLYEFFETPTIEDLARRLVDALPVRVPIQPRNTAASAPLSWSQQRLWFIDQLEGGSLAYHIPVGIRFCGQLDLEALERSLDAIVQRHGALRTKFIKQDKEPVQSVVDDARFELRIVDLGTTDLAEHEARAQRLMQEEITVPFDLSTGPLIRGALLRIATDEHVLLIVTHHIVSDGWSTGVLIKELVAHYQANHQKSEKNCVQLPPLSIDYADYAVWQRQWLSGAQLQEQLRYWTDHLRGAPQLLELPADRPRPATQSYRGANVPIRFGTGLTMELKGLARRNNLTFAMTLYAAWFVLLARLSGQDDIVVGVPVANRRRTELEGLIGYFVNTLAVRVCLDDDPNVTDFLQRVKQTMLGAYAHQDLPFEQVVEAVQPARSLSHSPIFQVMLVLQNAPRDALQLPGLALYQMEIATSTAQFDLQLSLQECAGEVYGTINFATDLFDASTVERWTDSFMSVLRAMVREPSLTVSRLPLMSQSARSQVVEQFNSTQVSYPLGKSLHQLFEEQAERTPHAVAAVCGEQYFTYRELNRRANQLARYLRERGVTPNRFVGLCVERSLDMVLGVLGILKAGGAYVPLDPKYPQHRLEYMLKDTSPVAVLTQQRLIDRLPEVAEAIALDTQWVRIAARPVTNVDHIASSDNLAYVIYTSGSTGQPKGVAIEHRNAVNLVCWAHDAMPFRVFEETLHSTSLSFDLSVYELFVPLTCGATLRVVENALSVVTQPVGVTLINTVPSAIKSVLASGGIPKSARVLNLAGEALKGELVKQIFAESSVEIVCNLYGPSETTTYSTWIAMPREEGFNPTIGRPIANTQVYVLDKHGEAVPIGVIGEIYIGGAGVARGYLNRPELTEQRFLPDPFSQDPQARCYRTGDLGRWRPDGTIEFLGRNDHQVKVRGFRIELGEVEAQLTRHAHIKEAVVLAREDAPGEKRLVAYFVPRHAENAPNAPDLRAHLKSVLPEYMVPSTFVALERMPLTPNGKLDRAALPMPESGSSGGLRYEPPQGEVEEILAGVWQSLLRVERVGRGDNFFELGGHSLLIIQLLARLKCVGLSGEIRRVYESTSLADLAANLTRNSAVHVEIPPKLIPERCERVTSSMLSMVDLSQENIDCISAVVPGGALNIDDIYPLTPLQEGILFHHLRNEDGGDAYVRPVVLSVSSRQQLEQLIGALQLTIDRHDVLRTAVLWEGLPQPVQVVYRKARLSVAEAVLDQDRAALDQIEEWLDPQRQSMDLRRAPLVHVQFAQDRHTNQVYVLLRTHHIIGDYVSQEMITAEIARHLRGTGDTARPSHPYRGHVAQAQAYALAHDAEKFFRHKLMGFDEPSAPFGLIDVHGNGSQLQEAALQLDDSLSVRLRAVARRLAVSSATVFHAAWALVVSRTSGRDDVVFGTVLLGRSNAIATEEPMLGMFINTLPLRLNIDGVSAQELVERTQRELIDLLTHEQASLATAQRCSGIPGTAPLFSALFNFRQSALNPEAQWQSVAGIRVLASRDRTNYPLAMSIDDLGLGFKMTAQVDRAVNPTRVVDYLNMAVRSLVAALEDQPRMAVRDLAILPERELAKIWHFNNTSMEFHEEGLVHQQIAGQARRNPNATALVYGELRVSYLELDQRANQVAHALVASGVRPDDRVALLLERSPELVIAMLGTLKAGGAYVPVDVTYPSERVEHMLRDSAPVAILTGEATARSLPEGTANVMLVTSDEVLRQPLISVDAVARGLLPRHLAYVIYTSGSTGVPKGVMIDHRGLTNLVHWHCGRMQLTNGSVSSSVAAVGFDAATWEIWPALCSGGVLMLAPTSTAHDVGELVRWWARQPIDVSFLPTPIAEFAFSRSIEHPTLRKLLVGGDQLRTAPASMSFELINNYGPTESSVVATSGTINAHEVLHIGRPIANTRIHILDAQLRAVPIAVPGEVYIAGIGVARGYLNRPDLTGERFVADPFSAGTCARMYRTGDLARWRDDGTIEYVGRNDHQVKVRGFRIEIGEIEAQLIRYDGVNEAVVIARDEPSGGKRLVAYITCKDRSGFEVSSLRAHLETALPDYMVPSAIAVLDFVPLTANGKVDRRALSKLDIQPGVHGSHEEPTGKTEEVLAQVWRDTLGIERVGRHDDFFQLGGHSLLAVHALSRANELLDSKLLVRDLYNNPTIAQLATRACDGPRVDEFVDLSQEAALDSDIIALPVRRQAGTDCILVTGATGFVGRFVLAQVLEETAAKVYCLVRASCSSEAANRLKSTLLEWGLWRDEFATRVVAIAGDLCLPRLGIDAEMRELLAREVAAVFHCGTSMNHLETYTMAKAANVQSARELLKLATEHRPKLVNYISTIGVFSDLTASGGRIVDERTGIDHERHLAANGYTASKWVAEKIFLTAAARGVACNVFRLGLVWADSREGRYDELQREYRVLKSCLISGLGIENYGYATSPIPVDQVARAIVYLSEKASNGGGVFHIVASKAAPGGLFERYNKVAERPLRLMPIPAWSEAIKRLHDQGMSLPVVPLVEIAFALDRASNQGSWPGGGFAATRYDSTQTQQQLRQAGLEWSVLNDRLFQLCIQCMRERDARLRELEDKSQNEIAVRQTANPKHPRMRAGLL